MARRRALCWAIVPVLVGAVGFGVVTWVALEGRQVIILRTRDAEGTTRETRTWVAEEGGALFVEAAHAERPFYRHLLADPRVEVVGADGATRAYRATAVANPYGHRHIRRLLAAKYGWADAWVGLLQDTSASLEVRLEPVAAPGPDGETR